MKYVKLLIVLLTIVTLNACSGTLPENFDEEVISVTIYNSSWFKKSYRKPDLSDLEIEPKSSRKALCMHGEEWCDGTLY